MYQVLLSTTCLPSSFATLLMEKFEVQKLPLYLLIRKLSDTQHWKDLNIFFDLQQGQHSLTQRFVRVLYRLVNSSQVGNQLGGTPLRLGQIYEYH